MVDIWFPVSSGSNRFRIYDDSGRVQIRGQPFRLRHTGDFRRGGGAVEDFDFAILKEPLSCPKPGRPCGSRWSASA